jgi:hypothetical protein
MERTFARELPSRGHPPSPADCPRYPRENVLEGGEKPTIALERPETAIEPGYRGFVAFCEAIGNREWAKRLDPDTRDAELDRLIQELADIRGRRRM